MHRTHGGSKGEHRGQEADLEFMSKFYDAVKLFLPFTMAASIYDCVLICVLIYIYSYVTLFSNFMGIFQ